MEKREPNQTNSPFGPLPAAPMMDQRCRKCGHNLSCVQALPPSLLRDHHGSKSFCPSFDCIT